MDVTADKRVLYYGPSPEYFERLLAALERVPGCSAVPREPGLLEHGGLLCHWVLRLDTSEVLADLRRHYVNLVVLDLRADTPGELSLRAERAVALLEALDQTDDLEERFAFHRVLVVVPSLGGADLDALVLAFGNLGVTHVFRAPIVTGEPTDEHLACIGRLAETVRSILFDRRLGRRALCAAGGGITGVFFELGALKCFDDCLPDGGVNDFDMYFGISAGAVVTGPLANGYSVDEYMAAIAGVEGGRIPALDLRLFRLGHLDVKGFAERMFLAARTTAAGVLSALTGRDAPSREALLFDYADLVAPPFRSDGFEITLRRLLTAPGATNDFRRLPRPLFVGATDQDGRHHVLFGDEDHDDVPISLAIQASLSVNPAFSSTLVGGRYYEDGAVTRTSNFVEAIRRGATLIFVLDPFVPYVARVPGFANRRGALYNIDQDVKTISYTRYETTRNWVLRKHPHVSAYTFVPANRLRRLLSSNPMDHRPYLEIWRGAYLSTYGRLRRLEHRLGGDCAAHGMRLDLARAAIVAERLESTPRPSFADFFPDGRVVIKRPPLCLERSTLPPHGAG